MDLSTNCLWVGVHRNLGIVVFDPTAQRNTMDECVELWLLTRGTSADFSKVLARPHLTSLATFMARNGLVKFVDSHALTSQTVQAYLNHRGRLPIESEAAMVDDEGGFFDDSDSVLAELDEDLDAWAQSEEVGWYYTE